MTKTLINR